MTGRLSLLLTADRAHGAQRAKARAALLKLGFAPTSRAVLDRAVTPDELDGIRSTLTYLHGTHKGIEIQAIYAAEWKLTAP